MYRIAHITDVHIKYDLPDKTGNHLRALLSDAISSRCDHILLTGDISDYADERDYELVRNILTDFNLLNSSKLSVVPGNHDIFGGPSPEVPFFMYPTQCKELDYDSKLNQFYNAFLESFENTINGENSFLPFVKTLNESIAVIGINSISEYSRDLNPLGTNGYVSKKQRKILEDIMDNEALKNKLKIIMIHHHFNKPDNNKTHPEHSLWLKTEQWKMRLHEKGELFDFFKKNKINMVLHGHTHITDTYARRGTFFINSSGCTVPFTKTGVKEYHILEIDNEMESPFKLIKREVK